MKTELAGRVWRHIVAHQDLYGPMDELVMRWFGRIARLTNMINRKAPRVIIENERRLVANSERLVDERVYLLADYMLLNEPARTKKAPRGYGNTQAEEKLLSAIFGKKKGKGK